MASSRTQRNNSSFSTFHHPLSSSQSSSSAFASYTANRFHSPYSSSSSVAPAASTTVCTRSQSPTRVILYGHKNQRSLSPTIRFSIDRPTSPNRSISINRQAQNHHHNHANAVSSKQKRTCACSPTTHPGSYRCAFHKSLVRNSHGSNGYTQSYHSSSKLNFRRSAMTNSLVRIRGVEGELVKRALSALIRPSSHHLRRRADFERRPSRLSVMSKAEDSES